MHPGSPFVTAARDQVRPVRRSRQARQCRRAATGSVTEHDDDGGARRRRRCYVFGESWVPAPSPDWPVGNPPSRRGASGEYSAYRPLRAASV